MGEKPFRFPERGPDVARSIDVERRGEMPPQNSRPVDPSTAQAVGRTALSGERKDRAAQTAGKFATDRTVRPPSR